MALLAEAPVMAGHVEGTPNFPMRDATRLREWMHRVISLLDVAVGQLREQEHPAEQVLLEATTLLRQQYDPQVARQAYVEEGACSLGRREGFRSTLTRTLPVQSWLGTSVRSSSVAKRIFRAPLNARSESHLTRS
jgi:hypothetical protein